MKVAHLRALEKVFADEIRQAVEPRGGKLPRDLPFQSKAKIFRQLCDEGMLEPMERHHRDRFGTITISGYQLSHAGRLAYCMSC